MKKGILLLGVLFVTALSLSPALATNGDNLIGIGPTSRSMGGVGIAAPQDAMGAIFSNPATMAFTPAPDTEFDFSGTLFMPKVKGKIVLGGTTYQADSQGTASAIPAIAISTPINKVMPLWKFGLAAYGSTGMGVDYRNTALDQQRFANFGGYPLVAGEFTQLQIMKFAPAVSFQPIADLSLGLSAHIDYATLDLRGGSATNYGFGAQLGVVYKPLQQLSLGATYLTPQNVKHERVRDFDGDGTADSMELEAPQQVGLGAAYELIPNKFLIEMNGKWINWAGAKGYRDYDWEDQIVLSIGAQLQTDPQAGLTGWLRLWEKPGKGT